jgi:glycine/D-amino acid oxidase-like deaminating enzyme/nitrite reductase/ring-hydroxylating ferredoxin subunit
MATSEKLDRPRLETDLQTDVCVVGAGIAGLSTAYLLCTEGKKVVVLDDGEIGGGESSRTTAHLTRVIDERYCELEGIVGFPAAKIAAESHGKAIDRIEEIVKHEKIDCDFARVDGYLFLAPEHHQDLLEKELKALEYVGIQAGLVERVPLDSFDSGPAIHCPRQAQFHPLRYLHGLAAAIERMGGKIFCHTRATAFDGKKGTVETLSGRTVSCSAIVVATNSPVNVRYAMHTKQAAYRTYVIGATIPADAFPKMLLWDTGDPYHYVRAQGETLIVGGEDHKTGQEEHPEKRFQRLERWAKSRFPFINRIEFRWSGQILEPADALGYAGKSPGEEKVYMITGDSGNGFTNGTLGAMIVTDLVLGRKNPWAETYDPARKPFGALTEYGKQSLNVMKEYCDLLTPGDVESEDEVKKGSGAVIRKGAKKIALYRDDDGAMHRMTAICPHMGCIVAWNDVEKSWDCPCHGSRFTARGKVVNGPANADLAKED